MDRRSVLSSLAVLPSLAMASPGTAHSPSASRSRSSVKSGDARIDVESDGDGPSVVLIPSLGRSIEDFDQLTPVLVKAGYRVLLPRPRGIGESSPETRAATLELIADDIAAVVRSLGSGSAVLVGHAFGNRVARMTATRYPGLVGGVALLAAGGKVPIPADARAALEDCFKLDLPEQVRMAAVAKAFFAPGNDPAVWREGWYPEVAQYQSAATRATKVETWWEAGGAPVLVVQGRQDAIAPPEHSAQLRSQLGERMTRLEVDGAGHALLPERPREIATALLGFLALNAGKAA